MKTTLMLTVWDLKNLTWKFLAENCSTIITKTHFVEIKTI